MNRDDFLRILRSLIFVFGAIGIIYFALIPNDFSQKSTQINSALFAWSGAFTMRRPQSVNTIAMVFVTIFYAVYIDEGLAFGGIALISFMLLIQYFHTTLAFQSFFIELVALTIGFFAIQFVKNILLVIFFMQSYNMLSLLSMTLFFAIIYPISNVIVYTLVNSRKIELKT